MVNNLFHTRCPHVEDKCPTEIPEWTEIGEVHFVQYRFVDDLEPIGATESAAHEEGTDPSDSRDCTYLKWRPN